MSHVIAEENDQVYCPNNHLVATITKEIRAGNMAKINQFLFADNQPQQISRSSIKPCFCGEHWYYPLSYGRIKFKNLKKIKK